MVDVILVQPKIGIYDIANTRLPLGPLTLAAPLKKEGYNVKIIDQRTHQDWRKKILNELKKDPILIGITSMTGAQIGYSLEISRFIKSVDKELKIVWGGVHASLLPYQTIKNPCIDIVVVGEGDVTLVELVKAIEKKKNLKNVKGIIFKEDKKVITTSPRDFVDLNKLPDLPYELVELKRYSELSFDNIKDRSMPLVTSRGCPFRCNFCYNARFNQFKWRALSAEKSIERLKRLIDEFKIKNVYFPEDNICADLKRFKNMVNMIIKEKMDISWGTQGVRMDSLGRMDESFLSNLIRSGCKNVDIGIESGSDRILKLMDKGETVKQMLDINRKISRFPFIVKYNFILGFPTETKEDFKKSVDMALQLIKENKKGYILFHTYTPFPGTKMYDLSLECGFKSPQTLEEWAKFDYIDWASNYPSWHTKEKIKMMNNLSFLSRLINKNMRYKLTNRFTRMLFDIYNPIARFRFDNNFYFMFIEKGIFKITKPFLIDRLG